MSLYRVHFKWKEKEVELVAKSLDLTHPYFVSIKTSSSRPSRSW